MSFFEVSKIKGVTFSSKKSISDQQTRVEDVVDGFHELLRIWRSAVGIEKVQEDWLKHAYLLNPI